MNIVPHMVFSDANGNIMDDPDLLMLCASGGSWRLPLPAELVPLPAESDLFLLPGRRAVGLDAATGEAVAPGELAVAAFAAPGYTLSAHAAWIDNENQDTLPFFAYGAVGYARGRFWICAKKVDNDRRQCFADIPATRIARESAALLRKYPRNRLVGHIINNCVRRYSCPAARNFVLGRHEAPLPTSRACNARCIGCISLAQDGAPHAQTPQCRLAFTPTVGEIVEVMQVHASREKKKPIYSFGQGCEGDPLLNSGLLCASVRAFRESGGPGTVNCNTNGSKPAAVAELAESGLTSMRVSINSAVPEHYEAYYRPAGYTFNDVRLSIRGARERGIFVSLNLLFFPGITDTAEELEALADMVASCGVSMIQWRNLNIDPKWYQERHMGLAARPGAPSMGLHAFMKNLARQCPWLVYGYFNPWLGEQAILTAPLPASSTC